MPGRHTLPSRSMNLIRTHGTSKPMLRRLAIKSGPLLQPAMVSTSSRRRGLVSSAGIRRRCRGLSVPSKCSGCVKLTLFRALDSAFCGVWRFTLHPLVPVETTCPMRSNRHMAMHGKHPMPAYKDGPSCCYSSQCLNFSRRPCQQAANTPATEPNRKTF